MAAVTIREGIRYGVSLLGYFVALSIVGGISVGIGIALAALDSAIATLIGFIILLIGIVIFYAGTLGVGYKLIADGVARGIQSLDASTNEAERRGPNDSSSLLNTVTQGVDQSTETTEPSQRQNQ